MLLFEPIALGSSRQECTIYEHGPDRGVSLVVVVKTVKQRHVDGLAMGLTIAVAPLAERQIVYASVMVNHKYSI